MTRTERACVKCSEKVKLKYIGRINGEYFCKKCRNIIRKNHRKETYENSDDKDNIRGLTSEIKNKSTKENYRKTTNFRWYGRCC